MLSKVDSAQSFITIKIDTREEIIQNEISLRKYLPKEPQGVHGDSDGVALSAPFYWNTLAIQ